MAAEGAALAAYRSLLKAARKAFPGDKMMIQGAAVEIRKKFDENRGVTSEEEIKRLLEVAKEGSQFMSTMIVQAELNETGNLKIKPEKKHVGMTLEMPSEEAIKGKCT